MKNKVWLIVVLCLAVVFLAYVAISTNGKANSMNNDLNDALANLAKVESQFQQQTIELEDTQKSLTEANAVIAGSAEAKAELEDNIAKRDTEIAGLTTTIASLESEKKDLSDKLSLESDSLANKAAELEQTRNALNLANADLTAKDDEIKSLEQQVTLAQNDLSATQKALSVLEADYEIANGKMTDLEKMLDTADETIDSLNETIEKHEHTIQERDGQIVALNNDMRLARLVFRLMNIDESGKMTLLDILEQLNGDKLDAAKETAKALGIDTEDMSIGMIYEKIIEYKANLATAP